MYIQDTSLKTLRFTKILEFFTQHIGLCIFLYTLFICRDIEKK